MKSVNLIIRLNSVEPTTDNDTAIEMALDRLGHPHFAKSIVSMLSDAGFTVALPIDSEVHNVGPEQPSLFDSDERFDLDGDDRAPIDPRLAECVASLAHLRHCDSDGYCTVCGFQDPYVPTHRSKIDGSEVMLARVIAGEYVLQNENGDQWPEPDMNDWEPVS